jgi:hypothetical protein
MRDSRMNRRQLLAGLVSAGIAGAFSALGRERGCGIYTAVAQNAKMKLLAYL